MQADVDAAARGHGLRCVLHQVHEYARQVFAGQTHRARAALGVNGESEGRAGQSGQQIVVGEEFGGQVRNRHAGQQVPAPACVGTAWIGNCRFVQVGRVAAGTLVEDRTRGAVSLRSL